MPLTRIPSAPYSIAAQRVRLAWAPLEMLYTDCIGYSCSPAVDTMFTMVPACPAASGFDHFTGRVVEIRLESFGIRLLLNVCDDEQSALLGEVHSSVASEA